MATQSSLFETLQTEFCPPLDTSLLAAFLADLEQQEGPDGDLLPPSLAQIQSLRAVLRTLADQASEQVEQQLTDELSAVQSSTTDSTSEIYAGDTASSIYSNSSGSSRHPFNTPIGFLQAALPHIPISRLREALDDDEDDAEDVDMEFVVESLLTSEYIKELKERGISGLDAADHDIGISLSKSASWETVEVKKKKKKPPSISTSTSTAKRKATRAKSIPIVDIRQKQHVRSNSSNGLPAPDPWTQLSSLSTHVASLIPTHAPPFFLSFFHNPDYPSPSTALRAALTSISESESQPINMLALSCLFEVVRVNSIYDTLDTEQQSLLASDAHLALMATSGCADDALDLVWLLYELEDDRRGNLAMGVYHSTPSIPAVPSPWTSSSPSIMHSPTPFAPAPVRSRSISSPPPQIKPNPNPFQWQSVPIRKPPHTYSHSAYIPSTNPTNARRASVENVIGKGGNGSVGELQQHRNRMKEGNELFRQAARAWKSGNKKTRGGEVAAYFAERAREVREVARKEQLERARDMVEAKRMASENRDTVDVHGTSVAEAIVIVKGILQQDGSSPAKPLKIITGRGIHSVNGIGVLGPAIRAALAEDGWYVSAWGDGLMVKGMKGIYER